MTDILRFALLVLSVYFATRVIYLSLKRIGAIKKLSALRKAKGVRISISPSLWLTDLRISKKPDATVEIGDRVYLIRFFSGRSSLSFVHFASEKFSVVYSKMRLSLGSILSRSARNKGALSQGAIETSRQKVYTIPALIVPEKFKNSNVYEVIMFSPEPAEITFVSKSKSSIKVAYTGDEVYGRLIFTPESFVIFADRQIRATKQKNEDEFSRRAS